MYPVTTTWTTRTSVNSYVTYTFVTLVTGVWSPVSSGPWNGCLPSTPFPVRTGPTCVSYTVRSVPTSIPGTRHRGRDVGEYKVSSALVLTMG